MSTRFSLSVDNEQTDAGQDGGSRLARRNSQARTGTGKYYLADNELDYQPYPVDPYSGDQHTYIHTFCACMCMHNICMNSSTAVVPVQMYHECSSTYVLYICTMFKEKYQRI